MALKEREGYCQFTPIFASILGLCMVNLEKSVNFTNEEKKEIRTRYSACNENLHLDILKQLIQLGADVNSHDINRYWVHPIALCYFMSEKGHDLSPIDKLTE